MTIIANTIGNVYDFQSTDGKNLSDCPEGMEWVKISEKKVGKGKGKTIAAISVPVIQFEQSLFTDAFNTARKEMLTMFHRAGKQSLGAEEIGENAVFTWYSLQAFSSESIAAWFDSEMSAYLTMNVCAAKGWEEESLDSEQAKYLLNKATAYKAAFLECASKFPKLSPEQKKELVRVISINELSGGIVDRIMDKLVVKEEKLEEALGF